MAPTYAVILAFYCTLVTKMGSGPMWNEIVGTEQEKCKHVWWANLLFINNYVDTKNYVSEILLFKNLINIQLENHT